MPLRALDDRVLPAAADRLRRGIEASRPGPAGPPPILVAALLVLVLAGAVAVAVVRPDTGAAPAVAADAGPVTLGPDPGQRVATYLTVAAQRRATVADTHAASYAVVDFSTALDPAATARLIGTGTELVRAWYAADTGPDAVPHVVAVSAVSQLPGLLDAAAAQARATAQAYRAFVQRLPTGPATAAARAAYSQQAGVAATEAAGLGASCACVYAVLVRVPGVRVPDLQSRSGVRVVDPAPPGVPLDAVTARALRPSDREVVPRTEVAG